MTQLNFDQVGADPRHYHVVALVREWPDVMTYGVLRDEQDALDTLAQYVGEMGYYEGVPEPIFHKDYADYRPIFQDEENDLDEIRIVTCDDFGCLPLVDEGDNL